MRNFGHIIIHLGEHVVQNRHSALRAMNTTIPFLRTVDLEGGAQPGKIPWSSSWIISWDNRLIKDERTSLILNGSTPAANFASISKPVKDAQKQAY
ncbi:hypothetical protein D8B26_002648 [Coccidioides posadasii str. Silveira]|uniref:uncharacterized protein n=1 Tax=Coccidioides posadasii (strain RMSCC 757 / Silveira) TaxID=443226 RepID=UPI001BEE959B|nr:hypothetical protein D8B26_002648 [Coccidioides posadasii str. Silveira]